MPPLPCTVASPLTQALALTREMLAAAKKGDWVRMARLEEARQPLVLRQHAVDIVSRAQIEQILAFDRQLQALLGKARDGVASRWRRPLCRSRALAADA